MLATIFTESLHDILKQSQGMATHEELLSYWGRHAVTVGVIMALAIINVRGTRLGGGVQLLVTTVKVLSLVSIAVLPLVLLFLVSEPRTVPSVSRLEPVWPKNWLDISWPKFGVAMLGVLWAYHGWMNVAPVAEEVRNPSRNLPLALIAGTVTIMVLYLSVNLAYYLLIPGSEMKGIAGRTIAGEFGFRALGSVGLLLISAAVMTSVFGALNGLVLVTPRLLYAMSEDGLAPRKLSALHPRYETPVWAILCHAAWASLLLIGVGVVVQYQAETPSSGAGASPIVQPAEAKAEGLVDAKVYQKTTDSFDVLTNYAIFGAVSFETLAVATIFVFRRRYPVDKVQLPYRCRFYPWVPLIYVGVMAAVLYNMFGERPLESLMGLGFILLGAVVYRVVYYRRQGGV